MDIMAQLLKLCTQLDHTASTAVCGMLCSMLEATIPGQYATWITCEGREKTNDGGEETEDWKKEMRNYWVEE
jgi:hypothetical protein